MYFWKQIIESHKTRQDKYPPKIKNKEQTNTIVWHTWNVTGKKRRNIFILFYFLDFFFK